jgi:serine/threonine protein phosphatase 1
MLSDSPKARNTYQLNTVGADYAVGDIHGCFTLLEQELRKLGFNDKTDRLFSVGDLVDRGPESIKCLEWLAKPWFHAVRGNHEQMAIEMLEGYGDTYNYIDNGGRWFLDLMPHQKWDIVNAFNKLPLWMEVKTREGLVGFVHGDAPDDWEKVENNPPMAALWGRSRIQCKDTTPVTNVHKVYVGHTPTKTIKEFGNVVYIDTGACFSGGKFSIVKIN